MNKKTRMRQTGVELRGAFDVPVARSVMGARVEQAPEWIMFLPGGWNEISGKVNGEAKRVKVYADEDTAAVLQEDLLRFRTEGGPQPFFDFDHDAEERSGSPQEFAWMDWNQTRRPGVWARVRWSRKGAAAVVAPEGMEPEYSHFSPRVDFDPASGRVLGLMPRGTGLAAGGLVNDPAFETISALTGGKTAAQAAQPNEHDMKNEMIAALIASGLLNEAESAQTNAHELVASRVKELKAEAAKATAELTAAKGTTAAEVAQLQAELTAAKGRLADQFVASLEASRKVPPLAEDMKARLKAQWLKDPQGAELMAAFIPQAGADPGGERLTTELEAGKVSASAEGGARRARATELMAAKGCSWTEAWEMAGQEMKAKAKA